MACDREEDTPVEPGAPADLNEAALRLDQALDLRPYGVERRQLEIEEQIPGFGGVSIAEGGGFRVYVKDPESAPGMVQALRAAFPSPERHLNPDGSAKGVEIVKGDYSMSELVVWKEALVPTLLRDSEVVFLDADEGTNRVRVGVTSLAAESRLLEAVSRAGFPPAAVVLEETTVGGMTSASEASDGRTAEAGGTVQDYRRPPAGGYQIHIDVDTECSLGFNVHDGQENGDSYHLTAGHCTNNFSGPTGLWSYQPSQPDTIAQEALNPSWQTAGCDADADYCNTADAALFEYDSWPKNFIAITTDIGTGPANSGTTVDFHAPVSGVDWNPLQNDSVWKTGRSTGTTRGKITGTCVDQALGHGSDSIITPCSLGTDLYSDGGDSGGPVFRWTKLWYDRFDAVGILSGGPGTGTSAVVNSWDQLEDHFDMALHPEAPAETMTVDLQGPSQVQEDDTCTWQADVGGDSEPPLEYTWLVDWVETSETSDTFDMYIEPDTEFFTLVVHVMDFVGTVAADTLEVDVGGSPLPPPCS